MLRMTRSVMAVRDRQAPTLEALMSQSQLRLAYVNWKIDSETPNENATNSRRRSTGSTTSRRSCSLSPALLTKLARLSVVRPDYLAVVEKLLDRTLDEFEGD